MMRGYTTGENSPRRGVTLRVAQTAAAGTQEAGWMVFECKTCGPLGAFTPDGSGPFDCWDCGRKAAFLMPELPPTQVQPYTEQWAADLLGLWPPGVEFSPELLSRSERARVDLVLLGAHAVLIELKKR